MTCTCSSSYSGSQGMCSVHAKGLRQLAWLAPSWLLDLSALPPLEGCRAETKAPGWVTEGKTEYKAKVCGLWGHCAVCFHVPISLCVSNKLATIEMPKRDKRPLPIFSLELSLCSTSWWKTGLTSHLKGTIVCLHCVSLKNINCFVNYYHKPP